MHIRGIGAAILPLLLLLLVSCGGGSSSSEGGNATLEALQDEAEQTPVEDYVREYAAQLCAPMGTLLDSASQYILDLETLEAEATPASFEEGFELLIDALGQLEEPFEALIEDAREIDPPAELEEYHEAVLAEMEYGLDVLRAIRAGGLFGAIGAEEPPPSPEEPPGLGAAFILECGAEFADLLEEFGEELLPGGSGDDDDDAPPAQGSIRQVVASGDFELLVHDVEDPFLSDDEFSRPAAGNRFLLVELSLTNISGEPVNYSSFDFRVKDNQNFEYDAAFNAMGRRPLDFGSLLPDETVRGQIAFEAPTQARIVRIIFEQGFGGGGRIDIDLTD